MAEDLPLTIELIGMDCRLFGGIWTPAKKTRGDPNGVEFAVYASESEHEVPDSLVRLGKPHMSNKGFLRVSRFILSRDVVARLVAEEIVDQAPNSRKGLRAVQEAFNSWRAESGRSFNEISAVLAKSIGWSVIVAR